MIIFLSVIKLLDAEIVDLYPIKILYKRLNILLRSIVKFWIP